MGLSANPRLYIRPHWGLSWGLFDPPELSGGLLSRLQVFRGTLTAAVRLAPFIVPRARGPTPRKARRRLIEKSIPLQKKLFDLAEAHLDDADREARTLAMALFVHFQRLFTFLKEEGVELTNNVAERTLRTAGAVAQDQLRQSQPRRGNRDRAFAHRHTDLQAAAAPTSWAI
jgi:hypothetical protein